jgi:hypothetical protein
LANRLVRTAFHSARQQADRSAAWVVFARDTISGFFTTAHHALLLFGTAAIITLCVIFVKPDIVHRITAFLPFTQATTEESVASNVSLTNLMETAPVQPDTHAQVQQVQAQTQAANVMPEKKLTVLTGNDLKSFSIGPQQQRVTSWLSKRYRVANDATNMLVSAAYLTARDTKLDPLLILAVMAIESGFNPFAESPVGAQGLMQVMAKVHHDKFQKLGGVKAALNPVANIKVGSLILKDYVTRGGSVEAGLKLYVGAAAFETDSGYGSRVLAEYHRLKDVAAGKKVPIYTTNTTTTASTKPQPATAKSVEADDDDTTASNQQPASTGKNNQIAAL